MVGTRRHSNIKAEASELQEQYAALEAEIRLIRELRAQVTSKLRKHVQSQARQSRRFNTNFLRAWAR